jgi:hypothetical protein
VESLAQAAEVLVVLDVLAAGVDVDSLVDEDDGLDEEDASAPEAAGVSVLGLADPLAPPERLSVL